MRPQSPIVRTGLEGKVARDSKSCVVAPSGGKIEYVDSEKIVMKTDELPDKLSLIKGDNLITILCENISVPTRILVITKNPSFTIAIR